MMTATDEQVAPPVDFPLYGLDASFGGLRWLDFFESRNGGPAWAVWLGHRDTDDTGVRVGTFPKKRFGEVMCPRGGDEYAKVATSAAVGLVNLTLPGSSVSRPEGLIQELVKHAEEQASKYPDWSRTTWSVGGTSVHAPVWEFAGAWAGFCDADGAFVVAIGIGVEPDELPLTVLDNGAPYGANLGAALDLSELRRQRYEHPATRIPPPQRHAFHADQLALVPQIPDQTRGHSVEATPR